MPDEPEFVCCSVIEFGDGGPDSVALLQRGTREECERVAELLDAISYSGGRRPIVASYVTVTPAENYVVEEVLVGSPEHNGHQQ